MKTKNSVYIRITKTSVALFLIADLLGISKYRLFLLYETFGNDIFLLLSIFKAAARLPELSDYRLSRCFIHAERIIPVLLGTSDTYLSYSETKSYQKLKDYLHENYLRIYEDLDAYAPIRDW